MKNSLWNKIKFIVIGYAIVFASLFVLQLIIYSIKFVIEKIAFANFSILLGDVLVSTALLSILISAILFIPVLLKRR